MWRQNVLVSQVQDVGFYVLELRDGEGVGLGEYSLFALVLVLAEVAVFEEHRVYIMANN